MKYYLHLENGIQPHVLRSSGEVLFREAPEAERTEVLRIDQVRLPGGTAQVGLDRLHLRKGHNPEVAFEARHLPGARLHEDNGF